MCALDIYLPDINGDEVAKIMKKDERLKGIPIILIFATTESIAERANECGADGCLTKPFEAEELIATIEKALSSRR